MRPLLKMYSSSMHSGDTAEFWDENWGPTMRDDSDATVERSGAMNPLEPLMKGVLDPARLAIDGGCGPAHWVRYWHRRGYRFAGIDFARRTVDILKERHPELDVRHGDVLRLPFADGEVHTYYSGGVVEHFVDGPEPALVEARRVLAPDGWFLCSVPDASWLRDRILYRRQLTETRAVGLAQVERVETTRRTPSPRKEPFFQYAFSEREFTSRLERAGFRVERSYGMSFQWGVLEVPGVERCVSGARAMASALRSLRRPGAVAPPAAVTANARAPRPRGGIRGALEDALLREDRTTPVLGPLVGFATEIAANMRMYVARPRA